MPSNRGRHETDTADEMHIAGVVVHARADAIDRVTQVLQCLPGAQVHGTSEDGKLVSRSKANARRLSPSN